MANILPDSKLDIALWEADLHAAALADQLLFRFTKLQDALGERLLPATLAHLAEPFEAWSMRDRLNRLEKLDYLDVGDWLRWRELRNRLAHEYPDQPALRFATLNAAIAAASELVAAYEHWKKLLLAAT